MAIHYKTQLIIYKDFIRTFAAVRTLELSIKLYCRWHSVISDKCCCCVHVNAIL